MRQDLGENPATAVPDERDARGGFAMEGHQRIDQRPQHDLRVGDVESHARKPRAISDATKPIVLRTERPVAREESRDEEHGATKPEWNVVSAKDRVAYQPEKLEVEATLQPHRWDRVPATHTSQLGKHRGGRRQPPRALVMWWF